ncbi:MAG: asparagine synthase (glutamine-hydrolyzing) [Candidatus Eisenbacteria bacterium]|uniref:asparagine synthase (glutamine-hydrolyzing) n=1 Tax=Eiseniibacteriota bacterium TaxID=2212470 RepID=A0A538UDC1_UNCEI|nr:MAG: asparagine synthase (glutamine-hydrolyzing) [Candidatus Eisenbacteria bacterium]
MCGIAGKVHVDPTRPVEGALLDRMCAALAHRGPDDQGTVRLGPAGLGHRRLSVLDLSSVAHQPMASADQRLWIVFNGEIYNFLGLRAELERAGHRFRSRSDTEVLLRLYETEGLGCLRRLRGMFAFAVWDARAHELVLVRDRLGVKPLFYHVGREGLTFASELKAVLQDPAVARVTAPAALDQYLTYQYVPAPHCVFRDVRKLPPGHWLRYRDGRVEIQRYWQLHYQPKRRAGTAAELRDVEHELRLRLEEAVRLRLVSDVPVGAFLSGGIDSGAVVAMMSRSLDQPVRTFSIAFDDERYDESAIARRVAERFGAQHTEFSVRPDVVDLLPALARHYDEPYADASAIPTYILAELARQQVTVVLNGDGGDECFAGYDRYRANQIAQALGPLAGVLGSAPARALVGALPHGHGTRDTRWRLKRFVEHLRASPVARNLAWLSQFDAGAKVGLYTEAFRREVAGPDAGEIVLAHQRGADAAAFLDRVLAADVATYLPDCLLVKVDMATMAHGLEARSPFLDHTLMEFAARLPAEVKLRRGRSKWILRRALRGILPREVLARPKMGFNPPVDVWLRGPLRDAAHELLAGPRARARGMFSPPAIARMLDQHERGRWNWHTQLWTLMMLELWLREYVDRAPTPASAVPPAGAQVPTPGPWEPATVGPRAARAH